MCVILGKEGKDMKENEIGAIGEKGGIGRVYRATVISNYFVEKGFQSGCSLTPMQINKLTSISHGYFLALTGQPLIGDPVEAWEYGPVVRSVYERYRLHGRYPVHAVSFQSELECQQFQALQDDLNAQHVLEGVWMGYGAMTGFQLSEISHEPGTPWFAVWHEQDGKKHKNTVIPDALIQDYYLGQLGMPL
jgi:uncharacterized phage-associated protein